MVLAIADSRKIHLKERFRRVMLSTVRLTVNLVAALMTKDKLLLEDTLANYNYQLSVNSCW
ncbi:MAG: hypothetical protein AAFR37_04420 [Cyanobacteria bacterium J06628_3]